MIYGWKMEALGSFREISANQINIETISHALSMQCRFNGHIDRFYSVAEHCVLCAERISDPQLKLTALLHDANEAYAGDVIRPVRQIIGKDFEVLASFLEMKIYSILGITSSQKALDAVKIVDDFMLEVEGRLFFKDWEESDVPLNSDIIEWQRKIKWNTPEEAKAKFQETYHGIK